MVNSQNKSKLLLLIIAVLVVANIGLLVFFLQNKAPAKQSPRQDRKAYITAFLKSEIGFDAKQLRDYDSMSTQHRKRMGGMSEKLRDTKSEQFIQLVKGEFSDSIIDSIAQKSAAAQMSMEVLMLNHIKNIRTLCTPGQVPRFDSVFVKVFNKRGEGRKKQVDK